MTTKQSNLYSRDGQQYDEVEYDLYCNSLAKQYKQAKQDGIFEILRVLELDKEHSDSNLVQAVEYFKEKDGIVEEDAPMGFLAEREKRVVNRDAKFHPGLYCMLLSIKLSDAFENKSVFMQHSFKYAFDSQI